MECKRKQQAQWMELEITGRLDAGWAEGLDRELAELMRDGVRRIYLDMAGITFLSSAGIRILLKYRKEYARVSGSLVVCSPSPAVRSVLELSGLLSLMQREEKQHLHGGTNLPGSTVPLLEGGSMTLYHPAPGAALALRTVGTAQPGDGAVFTASRTLELPADSMAIGLGGFGSSFAECRQRFGEFMAMGGSAIALPTDGGARPDFLVSTGRFVPSVQALYAIACQGSFAGFFQFNAQGAEEPLLFSRLLSAAFAAAESDCIALAMIAETGGLVGASLLGSPAMTPCRLDFPEVRERLALTSEPAWPNSLALVCGVALRRELPALSPFVRPLGDGVTTGHFHGAALSYRALSGGLLELAPTVAGLMETQNLLGVVHLLNDTRQINGIGESRFLRGAVWCGPAVMQEAAP